jgi:hypothetical protein
MAWVPSSPEGGEQRMGLIVVLLLLALLFGGVGLFAEGLKILLLVAIVLAIASLFSGYRYYGRRG